MRQEAAEAVLRSLRRLQASGEYSDLKVFCGDQVFLIHKALVCTRSAFFAKACRWGDDIQTKGEIDLAEDDPKLVKLMIDYLYQLDYDGVLPPETPSAAEDFLPQEPGSPVARTVKFFESMTSDGTPAQSAVEVPDPRIPWDYMLTPKEKKRKEKQMRLEGTWTSRLTQEMIDEDGFATAEVIAAVSMTEPEIKSEPRREMVIDGTRERPISGETSMPSGKLRLPDAVVRPETERIVVNANLYALADKYGIEDLKLLAQAKSSEAAAQHWKSEAFVRAAELAFRNTPSSDSGLRSVVLRTLHEHRELTDYEETQDLLDSGNGIAWQLVKVLISGSRL